MNEHLWLIGIIGFAVGLLMPRVNRWVDRRKKASRQPKYKCNVCGLPADRFSSFGEDYYRHPDGTIHERIY